MEVPDVWTFRGFSEDVPGTSCAAWGVHDQSGSAGDRYNPNKQIRFKISMVRLDLCDCSDAYIVVRGTIALDGTASANNKIK